MVSEKQRCLFIFTQVRLKDERRTKKIPIEDLRTAMNLAELKPNILPLSPPLPPPFLCYCCLLFYELGKYTHYDSLYEDEPPLTKVHQDASVSSSGTFVPIPDSISFSFASFHRRLSEEEMTCLMSGALRCSHSPTSKMLEEQPLSLIYLPYVGWFVSLVSLDM
uniref:Uncharacterized protein n=1 Tax=Cucumis melo TaxID=3656 RepID=A0A9I9EHV6_CUCME